MRMLMIVEYPHEPFNTLVRKGTAGELIGKILAGINRKRRTSRNCTAGAPRCWS